MNFLVGILAGGIDPLKLIEGILNKLIEKGLLTTEEAKKIIDEARAPNVKK